MSITYTKTLSVRPNWAIRSRLRPAAFSRRLAFELEGGDWTAPSRLKHPIDLIAMGPWRRYQSASLTDRFVCPSSQSANLSYVLASPIIASTVDEYLICSDKARSSSLLARSRLTRNSVVSSPSIIPLPQSLRPQLSPMRQASVCSNFLQQANRLAVLIHSLSTGCPQAAVSGRAGPNSYVDTVASTATRAPEVFDHRPRLRSDAGWRSRLWRHEGSAGFLRVEGASFHPKRHRCHVEGARRCLQRTQPQSGACARAVIATCIIALARRARCAAGLTTSGRGRCPSPRCHHHIRRYRGRTCQYRGQSRSAGPRDIPGFWSSFRQPLER